jgi:hypothetical protein
MNLPILSLLSLFFYASEIGAVEVIARRGQRPTVPHHKGHANESFTVTILTGLGEHPVVWDIIQGSRC